MVEAHKWTTRRNSNHRLSSDSSTSPTVADSDHLLVIPATPSSYDDSPQKTFFSPAAVTATVIAAWYSSNIGILLLNKYLFSIYGFRYPIFLTTLHMLSFATYSSMAVHRLSLVPHQPFHSRRQLLKILSLSVVFCFSVVCGNASLCHIPLLFGFLVCIISTVGRTLKSVIQGLILSSES